MFIVFGNKHSRKVLGFVDKQFNCEHCHNTTPFNLVRYREWFTLYWIPTIPYKTFYRAECPICEYGYDVDKKRAIEIIADLKDIES